jgi:ComF family protein
VGQRGTSGGVARLTTISRLVVDALAAVLLAPACAACGEPLEHPTRGVVCARCWASIVPVTPPICDSCGGPLATWRTLPANKGTCVRCRRFDRAVHRARAIGSYEGSLRAILHAFKYDSRRSLARPLAALMRTRAQPLLDGVAFVVPVPLHPSRRRQRGFNQAADLAAHLGVPVLHALDRTRRTRTQTELPAAQRYKNVRGAFAARRSTVIERQLRGSTVVLVDDVSTTGATLDACARALKLAGVEEVRALTVARAIALR